MEGLVALALAILSVPFLLPIASWIASRRLRRRMIALEERLEGQEAQLRQMKAAVTRLSRPSGTGAGLETGPAPAAAGAPVTAEVLVQTARPAVAATVAPVPVPPAPSVPVQVEAPPPPVAQPEPVEPLGVPALLPVDGVQAPAAAVPISAGVVAAAIQSPPMTIPPAADAVAGAGDTRDVARPSVARPPRPPGPPPPVLPAPDEPERPTWSFDWERLVGVKLFSAVAGIALVLAAVLFLRYSIDHGWLQPPVRVAIGVLTAVALLAVCERRAARKYPVTANALDAAAIAILFATFFSAHALWRLIPASVSFVLLALVTATAVLLSIRRESLFIAVLGLLGGFATPVLLSTGENRPIPLFAYLLLLNVGLAWVAYRRGWAILSVLTLVLTTLYQWGWVLEFLASSPLPLALAIFIVFPVVGVASLLVVRSRDPLGDRREADTVEWTALASASLPLLFAAYLAVVPAYGARYGLLFGYLLLLDLGLFALAVARGRELLHAGAALTTLIVFAAWAAVSMPADAWLPACGLAAAFVAFYLAAPVVAAWFGQPFEEVGAQAIYVAPTLLFVFAIIARQPQAASPAGPFAALFALMILLSWRAIAGTDGRLYLIAAFFAIAAQASWSMAHLSPDTLRAGLVLYTTFGFLALGVPVLARQLRAPLEPAGGAGLVLLASLALLLFVTRGSTAGPALWGLGVLLAILNAAVFIESAAAAMPVLSLAGGALSWVVLLSWWTRAAGSVGLLPSLLLVVGLSLIMLGGHAWARLASGDADRRALARPDALFRQGLWLGLVGDVFLLVVAASSAWALPPWPLYGGLSVVTLGLSAAALAERHGALHGAGLVAAATVLLVGVISPQPPGWGLVELGAFSVLALYGVASIGAARRVGLDDAAAGAAAVAITLADLGVLFLSLLPHAPRVEAIVAGHVGLLSLLLALTARQAWPHAATLVSVLGGIVLLVRHAGGVTWQALLLHGIAMYVPFAIYPMVVVRRAPGSRDAYVAAILASAWCFLAARGGVVQAGYASIVGVVPVALGAVTLLQFRQLLRIEPPGARDLGRLALVAGAALAFLTVAIPVQLQQQWITIGWALEGAAVAWLYRRIPHRGLLYAAVGLLGAVFARLALNPEVLRYEPRGATRILNWYLYAYLTCAVAMLVAAWWLSKTDDRLGATLPRARVLGPAGAAVLLFLLLNIEIADFYATGPEVVFRFGASIGQDLTYTIGWLAFGLALLACGIAWHSRAARIASLALVTVTTFKCFLYDLGSLGGLYRIGAFVGLASSLALVSLALQKYVLAPGKESTR